MKHCLRGGASMVPAVMVALSFGCSSSSKGGGTGTSTNTSTGTSTATSTGPSFSTVYPIMAASCTNPTCHYSGAEASPVAGSLDMSSQAAAYMNLVGVAVTTPSNLPSTAGHVCTGERVVPGDSSMSLLYLKVWELSPPCGVQMPEVGANLTAAQILTIKTWIDEGANE
jgi:hypothetical protein